MQLFSSDGIFFSLWFHSRCSCFVVRLNSNCNHLSTAYVLHLLLLLFYYGLWVFETHMEYHAYDSIKGLNYVNVCRILYIVSYVRVCVYVKLNVLIWYVKHFLWNVTKPHILHVKLFPFATIAYLIFRGALMYYRIYAYVSYHIAYVPHTHKLNQNQNFPY